MIIIDLFVISTMKIFIVGQHHPGPLNEVIHGFYRNHNDALNEAIKFGTEVVDCLPDRSRLLTCYPLDDTLCPVFCIELELDPNIKTMCLLRTSSETERSYYLYQTMDQAMGHVTRLAAHYRWAIARIEVDVSIVV